MQLSTGMVANWVQAGDEPVAAVKLHRLKARGQVEQVGAGRQRRQASVAGWRLMLMVVDCGGGLHGGVPR